MVIIWHKGKVAGECPNLYDNTLHLPTVVRWPRVIFPNTCVNRRRIFAREGKYLICGRNFLPLLRGMSSEWDNDLFAQYSMLDRHQTGADLRTYRTT